MTEQAGDGMQERGNALKRRGILAAAGAVVAGIMEKQTAQRVGAVNGPLVLATTNQASGPTLLQATSDFSSGSTLLTLQATTATGPISGLDIFASGAGAHGIYTQGGAGAFQGYGVLAQGGAGGTGFSSSNGSPGVYASGGYSVLLSGGHGVSGQGGSGGFNGGHGVSGQGGAGASRGGYGVYGQAGSGTQLSAGVAGFNDQNVAGGVGVRGTIPDTVTAVPTAGVYGECLSPAAGSAGVSGYSTNGIGVQGQSDQSSGAGVKGLSTSGFPIIGVVTGGANINAGVLGVGTVGPGVQGQSTGSHGLVGTTSATDGVHAALIGSVQPGSNAIALRGSVQPGAVGYAGIFDGDVIINGALRVFGSPKNAAVKHPGDGTYRLLYCMESPESWFEDFGTGTLANGKADVRLDADFAALVHTDDYHVFLTPEGDSRGLYVAGKTATGFTVREQQGGTGNLAFSYRVVAKRKDIAGERLAKVAPPPPLKPVTPFMVPETPEAKPPAKKP